MHLRLSIRLVLAMTGVLGVLTARAGEPLPVIWHGPSWADPAQPYGFDAEVAADAVTCSFAYSGGAAGSVEGEATEEGVFAFSIPAMKGDGPGTLTLQLVADGRTSAETSVPVSERFLFDVTGDAAIPLPYPLVSGRATAIFIPCCTIFGGELEAYVVPVNPAESAEGLAATVDGPFIVLEPDALVVSTSGLNLQMTYGEAPEEGLRPAVFSFNKTSGTWGAISDPKVDEAKRTVTVDCPAGGMFVLGWVAK